MSRRKVWRNKKRRLAALYAVAAQNKESVVPVDWPHKTDKDTPDVPSTAQPAPQTIPALMPISPAGALATHYPPVLRKPGETMQEFLTRKDAAKNAREERERVAAKNATTPLTQIPTNPARDTPPATSTAATPAPPVRDAHNPGGTVGMPAKAGSPPQNQQQGANASAQKPSYATKPGGGSSYVAPPPQEDSLFATLKEGVKPPTDSELSTSMMKAIRAMEDGEERENCRIILEEAEAAVWLLWKEWKPKEEARKAKEKEEAEAARLAEENAKRNAPPPPDPVGIPPRGEMDKKGPFWESPYAEPAKTKETDKVETPVSHQTAAATAKDDASLGADKTPLAAPTDPASFYEFW